MGIVTAVNAVLKIKWLYGILLFIIIPHLYSALFMRHTFKGALHSVAATRVQVHPLPAQIQRDLTIGTD